MDACCQLLCKGCCQEWKANGYQGNNLWEVQGKYSLFKECFFQSTTGILILYKILKTSYSGPS